MAPAREAAHAAGPPPGEPVTYSSDGRALVGHRYRPRAGGPFPAVVVNHGSGLDQDTKPGVADVLAGAGYLVLVARRRGYGGSPGPSRLEEVTAPVGSAEHDAQVCARLLRESDDVLAALEFVRAMPEVDATRTAVLGSSYGGINSLLAASRDRAVTACVSFGAAAMSWGPVPGLRPFLLRHAEAIRCPVLLVQAENDYDLAPSAAIAEGLRAAGGTCLRHLFPAFGADRHEAHQIWVHAPHLWAPVVLPFLARHLGGASP